MLSSKCTCVQDLLLVFVNTKCFSDGVLAAFIYQDSSVLAQLGLPDMRLPTRIPTINGIRRRIKSRTTPPDTNRNKETL